MTSTAATWGLGLGIARPASSPMRSGPTDDEIAPHGCTIYYDFPATDGRPAVRLTWATHGGVKPRTPRPSGSVPLSRRGADVRGLQGRDPVRRCGRRAAHFPEALRNAVGKAPVTIKRSNGHHRDCDRRLQGWRGGRQQLRLRFTPHRASRSSASSHRRAAPHDRLDCRESQSRARTRRDPLIRGHSIGKGWRSLELELECVRVRCAESGTTPSR
jgi:hypothetical protein